MHSLTQKAISIWSAGVEAVRSDRIVSNKTSWDGRWLTIEDQSWDLKDTQRLIVVGAGKASAGMLYGLLEALTRSRKQLPKICGWINVPEGVGMASHSTAIAIEQFPELTLCHARPHGSNEPTLRVVEGTHQILRWVQNADRSDCVIALISGGGSALLCSPIEGVSLSEKVELTRALSSVGANIEQLNSVRRCLSRVKGGGLARHCNARYLVTVILSDVLGDPLELIASGPTLLEPVPDMHAAIAILSRLLPNRFPQIHVALNKQLHTSNNRTDFHRNPSLEMAHLVLANNATAVDAAGQRAVELGYRYWMKSERTCEGDAGVLGERFAKQMSDTSEQNEIDCLISGGEPTVVLPPAELRGSGGRNQHLCLSLANWFYKQRGWPQGMEMVFVSGGTDGEDGPTDAAGAFVDRSVFEAMVRLKIDPQVYLSRCDAYTFFAKTGGLLMTGPTGTNVCDLRIGLIQK